MKAVLTVGIPASGKSSKYAKEVDGIRYFVINRDDIREELFGEGKRYGDGFVYKFSNAKEKAVTARQRELVLWAKDKGRNIALTDTWLNAGRRNEMIAWLSELGYEVEVDVIECPYEVAVKRDLQRARSVGSDVIWRMFKQWHAEFGVKAVEQDQKLEGCYIFDIDGTLAKMHSRSPFEWGRVGEDLLSVDVWRMAGMINQLGFKIFIFSGRDSVCREETEKWLLERGLDYELHMREEGSMAKDFDVKLDLYRREVEGKYKVLGVFDDRPQVCRLWNLLGLPLFKVGDQGEF